MKFNSISPCSFHIAYLCNKNIVDNINHIVDLQVSKFSSFVLSSWIIIILDIEILGINRLFFNTVVFDEFIESFRKLLFFLVPLIFNVLFSQLISFLFETLSDSCCLFSVLKQLLLINRIISQK